MKKYYVYKYVLNEQIIYIGLTDDLRRRIKEHASGIGLESKFLPYLDTSEIYYHQCGNETEMKALESLLINHYKPLLNVIDVQPGNSTITTEVEWHAYDEQDFINGYKDDLSKYIKQLKSNKTRIENYKIQQEVLSQKMTHLCPFYHFVSRHLNVLASNPYMYLNIPRNNLPYEDSLYVGNRLVDIWYDEQDMQNDVCVVQLSGEFLRELFAISCKDNWIDETMDMIGNNECRALAVKIANLSATNKKLEQKIFELENEIV